MGIRFGAILLAIAAAPAPLYRPRPKFPANPRIKEYITENLYRLRGGGEARRGRTAKVLICGDVNGNLDELFSKILRLQRSKKGPFDTLLCVGDFDGEEGEGVERLEELLTEGNHKIPLPTYFLGKGGGVEKIAENLTVLGGRRGGVKGGVWRLETGIQVGWVARGATADDLLHL
eukprot:812672-Amorphochlora_amoeboformis.AAC.1